MDIIKFDSALGTNPIEIRAPYYNAINPTKVYFEQEKVSVCVDSLGHVEFFDENDVVTDNDEFKPGFFDEDDDEFFKTLDEERKKRFEKIGVSCHSVDDALEAERLGAAYITFGHVFATDCKKGLEPRGIEALRKVCEAVKIPVYAIGGINCENIGLVFENGAGGACVMSGFMKCESVNDFMGKLVGEK